jgi:hypothetical protein
MEEYLEFAKKLAKEAGIFYYRKGKLQVDMEKFAELLLKECITICGAIQGAGEVRNMSDFASSSFQLWL